MHRRQFLTLVGAGAAAAALPTNLLAAPVAHALRSWPGQQVGRVYLGLSLGGRSIESQVAQVGQFGLRRTFSQWSSGNEDRNIRLDHAAGRLPWVSFKPPSGSAGIWTRIARGDFDADLRARARRYAAYSRPVVSTFNHEPQTDDALGSPGEFAAAWTRCYDVMQAETGLRNCAFVPIIGEWVFSPTNRQDDPADFVTSAVLARMPFLGIDLYQNSSGEGYSVRLQRVVDWLDERGRSDIGVGLGETACSDRFGSPSAVAWWNAGWSWITANRNRVAAVSYYNSARSEALRGYWPLDESAAKVAAFRASLASSVATRLP